MEIYLIWSILFFLIGCLAIIRNLWMRTYFWFFWFCDFVPFILGVSFFLGHFQLIKSLINIGLLGQIFALITHMPKRLPIVFSNNKKNNSKNKFIVIIEVILHLTLPIALVLTYNVAPQFESIIYSFIILFFMFILVIFFVPAKENINAIYYIELNHINERKKGIRKFNLPFHTHLWIFYALLVVIANFIIQSWIYRFLL